LQQIIEMQDLKGMEEFDKKRQSIQVFRTQQILLDEIRE